MSKASANFGGTVGWDEQTVIGKRAPRPGELKSESAIAAAQRAGIAIDTSKKYAAGNNKQHEAAKNTAILDRETEELHHERVDKDVARVIQQARIAKEWTQADLARHINEKQQVVNEYEQSKAIPNQQVLIVLNHSTIHSTSVFLY
ncbi:unnamed protein product [Rotaria magnacalcarata]|uniref:HTH cro/C1-type domain-containing protein n=1 Tax=Rotaria magnacalcarata TaxID=392030 RepID=A0A815EX84_9BILA|nr:unnamed protein product [Rotaria magnacalcarata]